MWFADLVSRDELERVVIAAGHSVWIGGAVGVLLWEMLRLTPAQRTGLRYGMALAALLLVVVSLPGVYAVNRMGDAHQADDTAVAGDHAGSTGLTQEVGWQAASLPHGVADAARTEPAAVDWVGVAAGVWAAGFVLMLARMGVQLRGARRLMAGGEDGSTSPAGEMLGRVQQRLGWRRAIRVVLVPQLGTPAVVGMFRPVLLMPAAIACDLTPQQLEAILLHELAHIRRYDYLVNVGQLLVEALLFFNPAVWFISRQVRVEREACCDAFAARVSGEPVRYAEALAAVVGQLVAATTATVPQAAMAASGHGPVLDRVRRLLVPGYRPGLRMSGPMLAGTVVVGLMLLGGLWRATDVAVAAAAELMSDAERVQKIAEAQKETKPTFLGEGRGTVAGRIVTEDGSPVPQIDRVDALIEENNSSTFTSIGARNGTFRSRIEAGMVSLCVEAKGYAPAVWGPVVIKPEEVREGIEIVLKKGKTGQVRVVEASGEPIANVEIRSNQLMRSKGSTRYLAALKLETDEDGVASIPDLGSYPVLLKAEISGYQAASQEFDLSDGTMRTWQLKRAKMVNGRVTAEEGGKPVPDARVVRMYEKARGSNMGGSGRHPMDSDAPVIGRTDAEGRFVADTLNDQSVYNLAVVAEGYTPKLIYDYTTAKGAIEVALAPALHVRGKVVGTPEQLAKYLKKWGKQEIDWNSTVKVDHHSGHGKHLSSPVKVNGGEATFEISGFVPGELVIGNTAEAQVRVDATKNVDDLVIDLRAGAAKPAARTRDVELRIRVPQGAPPASGAIDVVGYKPTDGLRHMETIAVKVENGVGTIALPVGKQFRYESGRLAGYWFATKPFDPGQVLPEGEGPYVAEIEAKPAGAVRGVVRDAHGQPLGNASVSLIAIEPKGWTEGFPIPQPAETGPNGQYLITPVPLGRTYRIGVSGQTARDGDQRVLSEAFSVTGAKPLAQVDVSFVKGIDVPVRVVDERGNAVEMTTIRARLGTPWGHGFGLLERQTDGEGRFVLRNLSPDWPGELTAELLPAEGLMAKKVELQVSAAEQKVVLEKGMTFGGKIVDAATGKPVPNIRLRFAAVAAPFETPWVEVHTDDKGEFSVSTLKGVEHRVYMDDCYPEGATFARTPDGSYQTSNAQSFDPVDPRKEPRREFKVVVAPWHRGQ